MTKEELILFLDDLKQEDGDFNYVELNGLMKDGEWKVHVNIDMDRETADLFYRINIDDIVDNENLNKEDLTKMFLHGWKLNKEKNYLYKIIK